MRQFLSKEAMMITERKKWVKKRPVKKNDEEGLVKRVAEKRNTRRIAKITPTVKSPKRKSPPRVPLMMKRREKNLVVVVWICSRGKKAEECEELCSRPVDEPERESSFEEPSAENPLEHPKKESDCENPIKEPECEIPAIDSGCEDSMKELEGKSSVKELEDENPPKEPEVETSVKEADEVSPPEEAPEEQVTPTASEEQPETVEAAADEVLRKSLANEEDVELLVLL
ncbi:hypothetical protein ElyMa_002040800 [Elysia marginata]|uniref:Uncharacterized protein n=1 Tax=Elysia marginata TaxID=1093978 RepID=A0AAV4F7Z9_9GAST|nr:hypothetical protein ElyMa_002040800 [Elysia marginata]